MYVYFTLTHNAAKYSISAMCMEKLIGLGKLEQTDKNEEQIIKYYEQSGDILLLYLQNR